jgi:hypothetical protein
VAKGAHISLLTKLAAALLALRYQDETGALVALIPHEHAKLMSAEQIVSLFQFHHHPIPHEAGGPDEPWNLDPILIMAHRKETAKVTVPQIAKTRHLIAAQEEFRRKVLERPCGAKRERTGRWPNRPMRKP